MLQTGYILGRKADLIWFLGLPYLALAAALACQQWLSAVAIASVTLWITIPELNQAIAQNPSSFTPWLKPALELIEKNI